MEEAKQGADGDRHCEADQEVAGHFGGHEAQRGAEEHHALDTDVQNPGALVDQLAETGNGEDHCGFNAPGYEFRHLSTPPLSFVQTIVYR